MDGAVTVFDEYRGLGTITSGDGTAYGFHCTSIVDGSRTIEVGAAVSFDVAPRLGRWEATNIRPIPA
jgi:cold shock CspA family protein